MVTLDGTKEVYKLPNVKKNNSARKIVMAITTGWLQLLFFIYKCFSMGHKYLRSRKKGKKLLISMGVGLLASIIFIIYEPDKSELLLDFSIMFMLCTICTLVFSIKTFEEKDLYKTNNLTQSLTDVFTSLGEAAAKAEIPICFFIDEIQYIKSENLGALIAAIHRTNQLGYPIMIIAAGLPKIYSMLSSEKSYSERLFIYKEIDSLEREQAIKAIEMPIKQFNVKYSDKAINKIIEVTEGYPFFIQQLCQIVFQNVDSKVISDIDVENNLEEFFGKLDTGFFKLRYERCSAAEKKFIFAMVKCGELPCTIANIAEIMKKSINSISTARAQLINKGIIYPVKYRELDFTVPQFSGFIHRLEEYKQWDTI